MRNGFHELSGRDLGDAVVADVARRSLFNEHVDLGELLSGLFAARVRACRRLRRSVTAAVSASPRLPAPA